MDRSRAAQPRARSITTAVAVTVAVAAAITRAAVAIAGPHAALDVVLTVIFLAAVAVAGSGLIARIEHGQREIVRELGRIRMVDRERDAFHSTLLSEIRQVVSFNRDIAIRLMTIDERFNMIGRSADYATGYLDAVDGTPPSAAALRHLRAGRWTPPPLPPMAGN